MTIENPILKHHAEEIYEGVSLDIARVIRSNASDQLTSLLRQYPNAARHCKSQGFPLLAWAMGHGNRDAFRLLLDAGASPNDFVLVRNERFSLLGIATGAESRDFFDMLLSSSANPNGLPGTEPPLFTALYCNKDDRFEKLLQMGADINLATETGATIILSVAIARDYQRALNLVQRGAELNVEMSNGTNLRKIIESYPLPSNSDQGRAQQRLLSMLA